MAGNGRKDFDEEKLVRKLRKVCTPYGDETKLQLHESREVILELADMHMDRAEQSKGVDQMKGYIRSAALLAAAHLRFEIVPDDETNGRERTAAKFCQLISSLPSHRHSRKYVASITEFIYLLKRDLIAHRRYQRQYIERHRIEIKRVFKGSDELVKQDYKFTHLKKLFWQSTLAYKELICGIFRHCESVVGNPPCEYVVIGLGSIAKDMMNLHSRIKYVIIFKEKDVCEHESNLEYFRMVAVLFQIIVIGMGETPLSYVEIPGLNDAKNSWFVDSFTPAGFAIEGLMPLSYKLPNVSLSNPDDVKDIELVQTPDNMISCALSDIHLRNLLLQSCNLYGDGKFYREFKTLVSTRLNRKPTLKLEMREFTNQATEKLLNASPFLTEGTLRTNPQAYFSRPLFRCLEFLAIILDWRLTSAFEIVSKLEKLPEYCHRAWGDSNHNLRVSVAVACVLKIENYTLEKTSQRCDVFNLVGKRVAWVCIQQIWTFMRYFGIFEEYAKCGKWKNLLNLSVYAYDEDIWDSTLEKQLRSVTPFTLAIPCVDYEMILFLCLHVCQSFWTEYINSEKQDTLPVERANDYLLQHPGHFTNHTAFLTVLTFLYECGQYEEVIRQCEKQTRWWPTRPPPNCLTIREYQMCSVLKSRSKSDALLYCEEVLRRCYDLAGKVTFQFARIVCRKDVRNRKELKEVIEEAVEKGSRIFSAQSLLHFVDCVFAYQYKSGWIRDAFQSLKLAMLIFESKELQVDDLKNLNIMGPLIVDCISKMLPDLAVWDKVVATHSIYIMCQYFRDRSIQREMNNELLEHPCKADMPDHICHNIDEIAALLSKICVRRNTLLY